MTAREPAPAARSRITLAIRYDDFSNGTPDSLDVFLSDTAMDSGVPLTVAVVPYGPGPDESRRPGGYEVDGSLTAGKAALLALPLEAGGVELAQHGFDHAAIASDSGGGPAEFFGQGEAAQRARIQRGLGILEERFSRRPQTFVPPWNRFDASTLSALETLGFGVISAGRTAPSDSRPPAAAPSLAMIPATTPAHGVQAEILAARAAGTPRLIVGLLHPYDFYELATPWGRFEREEWSELVRWIARQPDVSTVTLSALSEREPDLGLDRLVSYARFQESAIRRLVPPARSGSIDKPLGWYPSRAELRAEGRRRAWAAALLFAVVSAFAVAGGWGAARLAGEAGPVALGIRSGLAGSAVLLAIRAQRDGGPYFRGVLVTAVVTAMALGAWL